MIATNDPQDNIQPTPAAPKLVTHQQPEEAALAQPEPAQGTTPEETVQVSQLIVKATTKVLDESFDTAGFIDVEEAGKQHIELLERVARLEEQIPTATVEEPAAKAKLPFEPLTTAANADRLIHLLGGMFRYCGALENPWLYWNKHYWEPRNEKFLYTWARQVARDIIPQEARQAEDPKVYNAYIRWARLSESAKQLSDMIRIASTDKSIQATLKDLDNHPWLFNCQNGTLNLQTGKLQDHSRADLLTKISPVTYNPSAKCDLWLKFLNNSFEGNQEAISYLQLILGSTLAGKPEKFLFYFHGPLGDNGKTTIIEVFRYILGPYSDQVPTSVLMSKSSTGDANQLIAGLKGKRFVVASELNEGERMNVALVNRLTGQGKQKGRDMYQSFFEFDPLYKVFIDANHMPRIESSSAAIWNRLVPIEFRVSFPKGHPKRIKDLQERLIKDEASGILNWALQGCLLYQEEGIKKPDFVKQAVETVKADQDIVGQFLEDCCTKKDEGRAGANDLYQRFRGWSQSQGTKSWEVLPAGTFKNHMEAHGFQQKRVNLGKVWLGLELKPLNLHYAEA